MSSEDILSQQAQRLDEIEARESKASKAPWVALRNSGGVPCLVDIKRGPGPISLAVIHDERGQTSMVADTEFIAHARSDVPTLIAMVRQSHEALRAVLATGDGPDAIGPDGGLISWTRIRKAVESRFGDAR